MRANYSNAPLREIIRREQMNKWHWIDLAGDDLGSEILSCEVLPSPVSGPFEATGGLPKGLGRSLSDRSRFVPCYRRFSQQQGRFLPCYRRISQTRPRLESPPRPARGGPNPQQTQRRRSMRWPSLEQIPARHAAGGPSPPRRDAWRGSSRGRDRPRWSNREICLLGDGGE